MNYDHETNFTLVSISTGTVNLFEIVKTSSSISTVVAKKGRMVNGLLNQGMKTLK